MKWRFLLCAIAISACQPDPIPPPQCPPPLRPGVTSATGSVQKFVINQFTILNAQNRFAIDLNGDCRPDNQLGNIVSALTNEEGSLQPSVDASVAGGQELYLLSVQSPDPTLVNAGAAGVVFARAATMSNPEFSGYGRFAVDATRPQAALFGNIQEGRFESNDPVATRPPVDLTMELIPFPRIMRPFPCRCTALISSSNIQPTAS